MRRIDPPEGGEKLPGFELQTCGQIGRLQERFLDFDVGRVVVVEFENDIREAFKIRIDRAIKRELQIACVKSSLQRIVIADATVIGAVNEAPTPVDEIDSFEVVTDASVVGNCEFTAAAAGPVAVGGGGGAEATTESSVVGNAAGALAGGDGVAGMLALAGSAAGSTFIFAITSCCAFTCCCKLFTVSVNACTCWRKSSTSLGEGDGTGSCAYRAACAHTHIATMKIFLT